MHKRIGVTLLISDPFSEESMLGISSMLGILFRSPNVVFCGATLQLYGFKGSSIVVSSLPGIPNKCICQAQGPLSRPLLVNSWVSLRNIKVKSGDGQMMVRCSGGQVNVR